MTTPARASDRCSTPSTRRSRTAPSATRTPPTHSRGGIADLPSYTTQAGRHASVVSWPAGSVAGGPVDELLGATVEGLTLDELEVEVERAVEDAMRPGLSA